MRVKLKTIYAGPSRSYQPGEVADLSPAEAYGLCEGGYAEQVDSPEPPVEAAVAPAMVEQAVEAPVVEEAVQPVRETAEAPANRRRGRKS